MIFEKSFKLFKRFLKENGTYMRAMKIYDHKPSGRLEKMHIIDRFKYIPPEQWISDSELFCYWENSGEGRRFWFKLSILWKIFLYENKVFTDSDSIKYNIHTYCSEFSCIAKTEFGEKADVIFNKHG